MNNNSSIIKNFWSFVTLIAIAFSTLSSMEANAQCKNIAKKCIPNLSPYIYTGQLNSTSLFQGESAELVMAFTGGQQYRIMVCASDNLGRAKMVIMNSKKQVIFSNKDLNLIQYWDLKVDATDDYIIQISVPNKKANAVAESGCVALLVGFKNEY